MMEFKRNNKIYKIALLVSLACVLQISESLIPHPIPGLRLGLANMLTLTALVTLGFRYALEIAILRTLLSSLIMGTFMSPAFILSFSGAVVSTLLMGFSYWLSTLHSRYRLSLIGISIIGAFSHNMVQLYLAYLILVKHGGIFVFLPWLSIGSVATGCVIGVVTGGVCRRLKHVQKQEAPVGIQTDSPAPLVEQYVPGTSFLHRLPSEIKVAIIFCLSLAVLIFSEFWLYLGFFVFLVVISGCSHTSFAYLFSKAKRYAFLLFAALLLPLFFNSGTHELLTIGYFRVTYEGLSTGGLLASRILLLIFASALLVRTTSPEGLTRGIAKGLTPLRWLGISQTRIATILSLSWTATPVLWEMARRAIRAADLGKVKNLRNLLPLLSQLIAALYMETETEGGLWRSAHPKQGEPLDWSTPKPTTRTGYVFNNS
ncbi:MAG: Gx transporter family protein [Desulfobacteraceae bacterium]